MIFSELYSAYYNTVAEIIAKIMDGEHSEKELQKIVTEKAFGESVLTILPSLKSEKWQLVRHDMTTPLEHKPTLPLTQLQKEWLKAISLDARIKLFGVKFDGLDGVEPLFTSEDYYIYDKYSDGDPYEDEGYIERFRIILDAVKLGKQIKIGMLNRKGMEIFAWCKPIRLEYSEKDDKFRIYTVGCRYVSTVNLSKITSCETYEGWEDKGARPVRTRYDTVKLKITDERNALERVMLHFAHFEKQAEKLGPKKYLVKIKYNREDEAEMVIRILSFGPRVEVVDSENIRKLIVKKLKRQKNCGLK